MHDRKIQNSPTYFSEHMCIAHTCELAAAATTLIQILEKSPHLMGLADYPYIPVLASLIQMWSRGWPLKGYGVRGQLLKEGNSVAIVVKRYAMLWLVQAAELSVRTNQNTASLLTT